MVTALEPNEVFVFGSNAQVFMARALRASPVAAIIATIGVTIPGS